MRATTLDRVIQSGYPDEVDTVIGRLQDFLPEYRKTRTDEKFAEHAKAIVDLGDQLRRRRALYREEASRIVERVLKDWTPEQILEACGYPVLDPNPKPSKTTREVVAKELKVGMVLQSKNAGKSRLQITEVSAGMAGPYLTMRRLPSGDKTEHDTSMDSRSTTYTVEC